MIRIVDASRNQPTTMTSLHEQEGNDNRIGMNYELRYDAARESDSSHGSYLKEEIQECSSRRGIQECSRKTQE